MNVGEDNVDERVRINVDENERRCVDKTEKM